MVSNQLAALYARRHSPSRGAALVRLSGSLFLDHLTHSNRRNFSYEVICTYFARGDDTCDFRISKTIVCRGLSFSKFTVALIVFLLNSPLWGDTDQVVHVCGRGRHMACVY